MVGLELVLVEPVVIQQRLLSAYQSHLIRRSRRRRRSWRGQTQNFFRDILNIPVEVISCQVFGLYDRKWLLNQGARDVKAGWEVGRKAWDVGNVNVLQFYYVLKLNVAKSLSCSWKRCQQHFCLLLSTNQAKGRPLRLLYYVCLSWAVCRWFCEITLEPTWMY